MKAVRTAVLAGSLLIRLSVGQDLKSGESAATTAGIAGAVAYQTVLARADVAVAKSLLNEKLLKGEVGEAIRDQTVGRFIHRSGNWLNVSPRLGPQGLDHVSVQLNEAGVPHHLMVDETKFGTTAKLSTTKAGDIQMGTKWLSDRLSGLAKRYDTIRAQAQSAMPRAKAPAGLSSKRIIQVPLSDSETVVFWRPKENGRLWHYDGPTEALPKAIAQLKNMSTLFKNAADGQIDFRKRIFQVRIQGDVLKVNILDAASVDVSGGSLAKLPVKAKLEFPLERTQWASDTIRRRIANELSQQLPYLDRSEALRLARGIQSTAKTAEDVLVSRSFARFAALESAKAGTVGMAIAIPVEAAIQFFGDGPMDWSRVVEMGGLAGSSAVTGNLIGNGTSYALLRTRLGYPASAKAAELLGLRSASRFANVSGGAVGGGVTAILFAYGGYWLGYYDLQTANRSAIAGGIGVGAGTVASAATLSAVAVCGTAGTGAAISSLSGAAAMNASMAWLGGGTLASGGLGVAGGTVILGTGVGIVIVGATAAVLYVFQVLDEVEDNIRLEKTIEYLSNKQTFFVSN